MIKLHGSTPPNFIQKYKEIANSAENIRYIEDTNLAMYIGGADIMISDVSSAFMNLWPWTNRLSFIIILM